MSGIPIRNRATRDLGAVKATQDISMIATPAGAIVTGEIRKYETYQEMVSDAQPMRLASVRNASMDQDFAVPEEHRGGILFQRDFVNQTWLVLYTTVDMMTNLYIDWSHILNIPAWVGGVSNNRVRLTSNRYAETRTTYYSYGSFILILPDPASVGLGDQIVLEQYNGQGTVCVPAVGVNAQGVTLNQVDPSLGSTTLYTVQRTGTVVGSVPILDEYNTILSYVCSEDLSGHRMWARVNHDTPLATIQSIRNDFDAHLVADDPHPQYLKKADLQEAVGELTPITYVLPEATTDRLGGSYLATVHDVTSNVGGCLTVTATVLHDVLVGYAKATHNHKVEELENVAETPSANNQALLWSANSHKWYPTTLSGVNVQYDDATYNHRGLVVLASVSHFDNKNNTNYVFNGKILHDILDRYRAKSEPIYIVDLADVNITTLMDGSLLAVRGGAVVQITPPDATKQAKGYIQIAKDSDIFQNTTVDNKAVTPRQIFLAITSLIGDIQALLNSQAYTLPHATISVLGGVQLIANEHLAAIVQNYGTASQVATDEWVTINPMQFASYIKALQSAIDSLRSDMTTNIGLVNASITSLETDYTKFRKYMIGTSQEYLTVNSDSPSYVSVITTINNNHTALVNRVTDDEADLARNWTDHDSLGNRISTLETDLPANWTDHATIRQEFAAADEAISDRVDTFDGRITTNSRKIESLLPVSTVILWYGDPSAAEEGGAMEDWRVCDGNVYKLQSRSDPAVTKDLVTPNMLGRYPQGAVQNPGAYIDAGLPNIYGTVGHFPLKGGSANSTSSGAFTVMTDSERVCVAGDEGNVNSSFRVEFSAAQGSVGLNNQYQDLDSTPFGKADTVVPKSVTFIYLIKVQDADWEYLEKTTGITVTSPIKISVAKNTAITPRQIGATAGDYPVSYSIGGQPLPYTYNGITIAADGSITGTVNAYNASPRTVRVDCSTEALAESVPCDIIFDFPDKILVNGSNALSLSGTKDYSFSRSITFYTGHINANLACEMVSSLPAGINQPTVTQGNYGNSQTNLTVTLSGVPTVNGRFESQIKITGDRCKDATFTIVFLLAPHYIVFDPDNPTSEDHTIRLQMQYSTQTSSTTFQLGLTCTNGSNIYYTQLGTSQIPSPYRVTLNSTGVLTVPKNLPKGTYEMPFKAYSNNNSTITADGTIVLTVYDPDYIDFSMYNGSKTISLTAVAGRETRFQLALVHSLGSTVIYQPDSQEWESIGVSFTTGGLITVLDTAPVATRVLGFTASVSIGSAVAEDCKVVLNIIAEQDEPTP